MKSISKLLSFILLLLICCNQSFAADYMTFESFYSSGGLDVWDWSFIIAGTVIAGVIAFFTCGSTIPAWMATVGAWIGSTVGLSGIAATNFGLALLGGGAVAAGGLGIAGGVAVLSAALTFGIDTTITYSADIALEKWSNSKFIEANKEMLTLPVPRNSKGGKAYKKTITLLQKEFNIQESIDGTENQKILKKAINFLIEKMPTEDDYDYIVKNKTLLALLYLQTNNYVKAAETAQQISASAKAKELKTLPSFIFALATLSSHDKACTEDVMQALRIAYYHEPENMLIPIMTGSCMDRMMYRYHYGKLTVNDFSNYLKIITHPDLDKEQAAASLDIFIYRCFIELKRTQQDIHIVTQDNNLMKNPAVIEELLNRFDRHKKLIKLLQNEVLPQLVNFEKYFPKDSKTKRENLLPELGKYWEYLPELEKQINKIDENEINFDFIK